MAIRICLVFHITYPFCLLILSSRYPLFTKPDRPRVHVSACESLPPPTHWNSCPTIDKNSEKQSPPRRESTLQLQKTHEKKINLETFSIRVQRLHLMSRLIQSPFSVATSQQYCPSGKPPSVIDVCIRHITCLL